MKVAIHQPNYAPWLGYFAKIAAADVFIFLDDVQFSKNSYINRVQIDAGGKPRWLTVPVSYSFGDPINRVVAGDADWRKAHLDALKTYYRNASDFPRVWSWLCATFANLPRNNIAETNAALIERIAAALGLRCRFYRSSEFQIEGAKGDDRLIALATRFGPGATYISGKGGANYQSPEKFAAAGIVLEYNSFSPSPYDQGHPEFLPGLSVLDALFRLGSERTAGLLKARASAA